MQTWQGKARDLLCIDEAAQFPEEIIRTLIGWVRSTDKDQRCRVLLGSNPPLSDEGQWMNTMFAPWIDPKHADPAEPGEIRWYCTDAFGNDVAVPVEGVYEYDDHGLPVLSDKEPNDPDAYEATSRTFIPAQLKDNPYLLDSGYKQTLDNLPEPLRSALRDGKFNEARHDHQLQLIPSEWITDAQDRWTPHPPNSIPMCAIGVDVAQGGADSTVLSPRHDSWFAELISKPGRETPDGNSVAGLVMQHRLNQAEVIIDLGGGYGNSTYERLRANIENVFGYKGSEKSRGRTSAGNLKFYNKRAECYYRLREALDPSQPGGSDIALPKDPELFGELCSIRLKEDDVSVIQLESKVNLIKRVGKSPDKADAVVMAWSRGAKTASHYNVWRDHRGSANPKVNTSKRSASRHKRAV